MMVMTTPSNPARGDLPIVYQIAASIRNRITSGELTPGDPVSTIAALREEWGVAAATAQDALAILKREGLISGGRGKAATVRKPPKLAKIAPGWQQQRFKDQAREADGQGVGTTELVIGIPLADTGFKASYQTTSATSELAAEFSVNPGVPLLERTYETVDQATGLLLLWSVSYIPIDLIQSNPDLLDEAREPWKGGHYRQLATVGVEVDRLRMSASVTEPTPADRTKWGLDLGVALLRVRRRSIDIDDRVVEVADSIYPGDRAEIEWTEQLERWTQ